MDLSKSLEIALLFYTVVTDNTIVGVCYICGHAFYMSVRWLF